ncbi:hypothetical protein KJ708_01780 [bacterium]|nr:hypothetical protein [bacterium]MBU1916741.1 hypothetical protein [bacterium]
MARTLINLFKYVVLTVNWHVLATAGFITLVAFTASTTMADGQKAMENYTERSQAYYIALGGTEYAKYLKEKGADVNRTNMKLGEGSFSIRETEEGYLEVESKVDDVIEQILSDFE